MSWSSGTNTIKEGDESKSLTLQMLELKKQGGGTELFVRKNDVKLGTKSVTQNGTYTAAADGKSGFSQFSVNVRGGNGSADSHGKPTGGDIKPGGAGSAVVGTDPETGNEVVIGVDEEENLVKTPLPSSIVLVTPPTKMDYNDGESIDLSGAVVVAKNADGTTWTDVDHPNGHVSCTPDPAAADASQVSGEYWSDGQGVNASYFKSESEPISPGYNWYRVTDDFSISAPNTAFFLTKYGPYVYMASVDGAPVAFSVTIATTTGIINTRFTTHGNFYLNSSVSSDYQLKIEIAESSVNPDGESGGDLEVAGGTQEITLNWARPGDGNVLSTTMEINVGAHSTESSSGTEGSGGGCSF